MRPLPTAGEAEQDLAGVLRRVPGAELEHAGRGDRRVAAELDQRAGEAVLGEQFGAVGVEEPHQGAGLAGRGLRHGGERQLGDALLDDGADRVGDLGVRAARR